MAEPHWELIIRVALLDDSPTDRLMAVRTLKAYVPQMGEDEASLAALQLTMVDDD